MTVWRDGAPLLCTSNIVVKNIVSRISPHQQYQYYHHYIIHVPQISTIISLHNRWELVVDAIVYYAYKRS